MIHVDELNSGKIKFGNYYSKIIHCKMKDNLSKQRIFDGRTEINSNGFTSWFFNFVRATLNTPPYV